MAFLKSLFRGGRGENRALGNFSLPHEWVEGGINEKRGAFRGSSVTYNRDRRVVFTQKTRDLAFQAHPVLLKIGAGRSTQLSPSGERDISRETQDAATSGGPKTQAAVVFPSPDILSPIIPDERKREKRPRKFPIPLGGEQKTRPKKCMGRKFKGWRLGRATYRWSPMTGQRGKETSCHGDQLPKRTETKRPPSTRINLPSDTI